MKKLIIIACCLFITNIMVQTVNAEVHFIEKKDTSYNSEKETPCPLKGYNLTSCPNGQTPSGICTYKGNTYYKECACAPKYQFTTINCTGGKTLSGASCDGKYESCGCDTNIYKENSTTCASPNVLSGNSCGGNFESCSCPSTYSQTCSGNFVGVGTSCDGKYQSCSCDMTKFKTCDNGGAAGATSCTSNGQTYFSSCKATTCEAGGYKSAVPVNNTCDVVSYFGNTCYANCVAKPKTCTDGGYLSAQPSGQTCTAVTYEGNTCYDASTCKTQETCEMHGFIATVPSGMTCGPIEYIGDTLIPCYDPTICQSCIDLGYTVTATYNTMQWNSHMQSYWTASDCEATGGTFYHCPGDQKYVKCYKSCDFLAQELNNLRIELWQDGMECRLATKSLFTSKWAKYDTMYAEYAAQCTPAFASETYRPYEAWCPN